MMDEDVELDLDHPINIYITMTTSPAAAGEEGPKKKQAVEEEAE